MRRLYDKFTISNGCWEWTAAKDPSGYGRFNVDKRSRLAHRVVYEWLVGPIPTGLALDHLCRNTSCVNPNHLEPVTIGENTLRGDTLATHKKAQTHCVHGHEFTPANTYEARNGTRSCRTCHRLREWQKRRRAGVVVRGFRVPTDIGDFADAV